MALVSTNMIFIDPVAGLWNTEPQTLLHLIFPMENRKWRNLGHKIVWFALVFLKLDFLWNLIG